MREVLKLPLTTACFLCQQPFTATKHAVPVAVWDIKVCEACLRWNWDGIVPNWPEGKRLTAHLKERGIDLRLNADGWIEWPSSN